MAVGLVSGSLGLLATRVAFIFTISYTDDMGFSADPTIWRKLRGIRRASERSAILEEEMVRQLQYQSQALHELYQLLDQRLPHAEEQG